MQKLIRRSPSGPPLLCSSSLKPSLRFLSLSLPFFFTSTNNTLFTMPTATLPGCGSALAAAALTSKNPSFSRRFYTTATCSVYQPGLNKRTCLRAWPGRVGIRPAWCHSGGMEEQLSSVEESTSLGGNEGKEEKEKPIRLNRRQKGSGVLVGSPDLLTIPGVGPRNLRKLVNFILIINIFFVFFK